MSPETQRKMIHPLVIVLIGAGLAAAFDGIKSKPPVPVPDPKPGDSDPTPKQTEEQRLIRRNEILRRKLREARTAPSGNSSTRKRRKPKEAPAPDPAPVPDPVPVSDPINPPDEPPAPVEE